MMEKINNIPRLRFPEFNQQWNLLAFGSILISSRLGGNYSNSETDTGFPLIKMGNLGRGKINLSKIEYIEDTDNINPIDEIQRGDLFFNTRNTLDLVGKVAIWNEELPMAYYNSNLMWIKFENNYFMNFRLNSFQGIKALRSIATGTTSVAAIYTKDLLKIKLAIPSLPEQQKIADFLTAVDFKIQQLTRKKTLLEKYKKGVSQQIFSQQLRFKQDDGNDFPDWEERRLGDVADVRDGTHDSPKYQGEGYPLITSKNLLVNGSIDMNNVNYISLNDFQNINKRSGVAVGDILFGMIGTIGNPVLIRKAEFAIKNVALIKEKKDLANTYLVQLLNSDLIKNQFHKLNTGGIQKFLSLTIIRGLIVKMPSKKEQYKIASFLSEIDNKVNGVDQQIKYAQNFKKGLLQQMFI